MANLLTLNEISLEKVNCIYGDEPRNDEENTPVIKVCDLKNSGVIDYSNIEYRFIKKNQAKKCYLKKEIF